MDSARRVLSRDGAALHVTPKAFDLLALLVGEAPRVVTKQELHERLWPGTFVSEATLIGLVKELRKALDDHDTTARVIRTAHGVGYALSLNVAAEPASSRLTCHWLLAAGRRIVLREGENLVGRDPGSNVWLDSAGVSRLHARITIHAGSVVLEDRGSKNGTRVGDRPVTSPMTLSDGDRLRFGSVSVVYRTSQSGLSTETHGDSSFRTAETNEL